MTPGLGLGLGLTQEEMKTIHDTLSTARTVLYEIWYDPENTHINQSHPRSSRNKDEGREEEEVDMDERKRAVLARRDEMAGLVLDVGGVLITAMDRSQTEERNSNRDSNTTTTTSAASTVSVMGGGGKDKGKGKDSGVSAVGVDIAGGDGGRVHVRPLLAMAARVQELCASFTPGTENSTPPSDRSLRAQGLGQGLGLAPAPGQGLERPNLSLQHLFESNPSKNNSYGTTHNPPSLSSATAAAGAAGAAVVGTNFRSTSLLFDRTASAWRTGRVGAKER